MIINISKVKKVFTAEDWEKIGIIKLHMTTISRMELIDRMEKRLVEAKKEHNKFVKSLNNPNSRILKNFPEYDRFSFSPITVRTSLEKMKNQLNQNIITGNINLIGSYGVNVDEIFESYYANKPPFNVKEEKKYEFPDAFILKSVESWCVDNQKKMIFLSMDKDFDGYKSRRLLFRNDISQLLGEITEYYDSTKKNKIIPIIKARIERNKTGILDLVKRMLDDSLILEVDFERHSKLELKSFKPLGYKITSIRPDRCEIEYPIEIKYALTVFPTLLEIDKEMFEDNIRSKRYHGKSIIIAELEVDMKRNNHVDVKWINSNEKIRVTLK